jgi:hypothetical protein
VLLVGTEIVLDGKVELNMDLGKYKGNKVILLDKLDWNIVENGDGEGFGFGDGNGSGYGSGYGSGKGNGIGDGRGNGIGDGRGKLLYWTNWIGI